MRRTSGGLRQGLNVPLYFLTLQTVVSYTNLLAMFVSTEETQMANAIRGLFWGMGLMLAGIVLIHMHVLEMLRPPAIPLNPQAKMLDECVFLSGISLSPLGVAILIYSGIRFKTAVSRLLCSNSVKQQFPWDSSVLSIDGLGMVRFRMDDECIYCHQPTNRRRETWLKFYDKSLNVGAILGGMWAGIGGAMIGSAVGGLFRRPKSWPRSAMGISVNYGVCNGCRPTTDNWGIWLPPLLGAGWFLLYSVIEIAAGKGDEPASLTQYMIALYPLQVISAFTLSFFITERIEDTVRIRFDSSAIIIVTPSGKVEPGVHVTRENQMN